MLSVIICVCICTHIYDIIAGVLFCSFVSQDGAAIREAAVVFSLPPTFQQAQAASLPSYILCCMS